VVQLIHFSMMTVSLISLIQLDKMTLDPHITQIHMELNGRGIMITNGKIMKILTIMIITMITMLIHYNQLSEN
jgi:hypothetical protein